MKKTKPSSALYIALLLLFTLYSAGYLLARFTHQLVYDGVGVVGSYAMYDGGVGPQPAAHYDTVWEIVFVPFTMIESEVRALR